MTTFNWTISKLEYDLKTDISGESAEVQGIATAVWTEEVKAAQRAANENAGVMG